MEQEHGKYFPVFNLGICRKLRLRGFKIAFSKPNKIDPKLNIFYFAKSEEFEKAFDECKAEYISDKTY